LARRRAPLEDPDIRHRIIHSYIGLQIMAYNNLRTLSAALRDGEFGPEASIGKYYWSRWHQDFTEIAMDVMGTDALLGTEWSSETGAPQRGSTDEATTLRRAFVRGRAETIYAGASEIQKNIIAERVLKLPKEARR
jgi:alkylation response protein AidB-like acyl-CoA dehydrogenase